MPTGKKYHNATSQRVVSQEDMRDNIIDYMRESDKTSLALVYPDPAVIGASKTALSADGTDRFKLDSATVATDGLGNAFDTTDDHTTYFEEVYFSNQSGSGETYDVALTHAVVPSGININGRTALPEYDAWEEVVGFSADPDAVVDNGSTLTFTVNSVTQGSVDNSGRLVKVWKKIPASGASTEAVAIEEATVAFSTPNNTITITGELGQTTSSTTAADYTVCLMGPVVKKNTDLTATSGYTFIGTITGNGPTAAPTAFDISEQRLADATYGAIADITRIEASSPNQYKVSVSATSGDESTAQIEVNDQTAAQVFEVDGLGEVTAAKLSINSTAAQEVDISVVNTGTGSAGSTSRWNFNKTGGLESGDHLHQMNFLGSSDVASNLFGGAFRFFATEDWTSGNYGTQFSLYLTPNGAAAADPVFYINGVPRAVFDAPVWPGTTGSYDFGASGNRWKDIYAIGTLDLESATTSEVAIQIVNDNTTATNDGSVVQFKRDASAALSGADVLIGGTEYFGDDGTSLDKVAACYVYTGGTFGLDDNPTKMEWHTTADGSGSMLKRLEINEDGDVEVASDLVVGDSITCDGDTDGGAGTGILQISNAGTGRGAEITSTDASGTALHVGSSGVGIYSSATGQAGRFIGTGTGVALEAYATSTGSPFLIVPQSTAPSAPSEGCMYYDTEDSTLYVWTGAAWTALH